jgi:hypothetical protein
LAETFGRLAVALAVALIALLPFRPTPLTPPYAAAQPDVERPINITALDKLGLEGRAQEVEGTDWYVPGTESFTNRSNMADLDYWDTPASNPTLTGPARYAACRQGRNSRVQSLPEGQATRGGERIVLRVPRGSYGVIWCDQVEGFHQNIYDLPGAGRVQLRGTAFSIGVQEDASSAFVRVAQGTVRYISDWKSLELAVEAFTQVEINLSDGSTQESAYDPTPEERQIYEGLRVRTGSRNPTIGAAPVPPSLTERPHSPLPPPVSVVQPTPLPVVSPATSQPYVPPATSQPYVSPAVPDQAGQVFGVLIYPMEPAWTPTRTPTRTRTPIPTCPPWVGVC